MKIGLLSCTSLKKDYPCQAKDMYAESPRFSLAYQYARKTCDKVYILSAKYGLLSEKEMIEPYNETLNEKSTQERKVWSKKIVESIRKIHSLENDEFMILAGRSYYEYIIPYLMHYQLPLKGVSLGHWIPSLRGLLDKNNQIDPLSACDVIHKLFNQLPKLKWKDIQTIQFDNGIYIVFEKGEYYKNYDRIIRIGTHTSDGRLKERLKNHFITENKDGSIFRKNIGLALLSLVDDPYTGIWNLNTSSPDVCAKHATKIDRHYQKNIEHKVSQYLQDNMSFVCIPVDQTSDRLRLEEGLIATLNQSAEFRSSSNWLGLHNPKSEISQSGLWNSQCLNGDPLNQRELKHIADIVSNALSMMKNHTNLLNRGNQSSTEEREHKIQRKQSMSTAEIAEHINQKLKHAKQLGYEYLDVVSGDIHCELHLTNYMPSVCAAMRKIKQPQDQVLHTTPSGNSSTIKFRYFLKDRMYQLKIGW